MGRVVVSDSFDDLRSRHVRLLHGILKSHFDEDLDALIDERSADGFASVAYLAEPLRDWPAVVAMNFVVDLGVTRANSIAETLGPLHHRESHPEAGEEVGHDSLSGSELQDGRTVQMAAKDSKRDAHHFSVDSRTVRGTVRDGVEAVPLGRVVVSSFGHG